MNDREYGQKHRLADMLPTGMVGQVLYEIAADEIDRLRKHVVAQGSDLERARSGMNEALGLSAELREGMRDAWEQLLVLEKDGATPLWLRTKIAVVRSKLFHPTVPTEVKK